MTEKKPAATCPPHHWILDRNNFGHCKYCPATKQFPIERTVKATNDDKTTSINLKRDLYAWCAASSEFVRSEGVYYL